MMEFALPLVMGIFSGPEPEALDRCRAIEADAERLVCYDKLAGDAPSRKIGASAAQTIPDVSEGPAEFGLTEEQRNQQHKNPVKPVQSIESTVLAMQKLQYDRFTLQLENGQKWGLVEPTPISRFRVGDPIKIRKAALGSYLAFGPDAPMGVRVRRID